MTDLSLLEILVGMLAISSASMGLLAWYGMRMRRRVRAGLPYSLLMAGFAAWAFLYAADLLTPSLPLKILFHNLRFIPLSLIPFLELWLVVTYLRKSEWFRRDWVALLLAPAACFIVLALTSGYHNLFRFGFFIDTTGPLPVLNYQDGPAFLLLEVYGLTLLLLSLAILARESSRKGTLGRIQTFFLFIGLAFPTVINYLFLGGITPLHQVNLTPALLWVPAILFTIAIFRYRFLDIIPVARSRLFDIMRQPVLVLDRENRILDLNPAACTLFSTTPDKAIGRPGREIIVEWPVLEAFLDSQGSSSGETVLNTAEGGRTFLVTAEILRPEFVDQTGSLILLHDVTLQRQAETDLRKSEDRFRQQYENNPAALFTWQHREGDFILVDCNRAAERVTDGRSNELLGMKASELYATRPQLVAAMLQCFAEQGMISMEMLSEHFLPGRRIQTTASFVPPDLLMVTLVDVTDRRHAEALREELIRKLAQKNAELDRFTYTVSHDLKSPLIALQAYLSLVRDDLDQGDIVQAQADLLRTVESGDQLEHLITTLLALSRSGRIVDTPVVVSMEDVVRQAAGILEPALRGRGIQLRIPEGMPAVCVDKGRVEQVMTNLLDNAIRYMGGQPEPLIEVGFIPGPEELNFFVRDNGSGISPENLPRIFGLFERFNPEVPGSGIGLATVKRIIEAHGGRIRVESDGIGKGTTVTFTLPPAGTCTDNNKSG